MDFLPRILLPSQGDPMMLKTSSFSKHLSLASVISLCFLSDFPSQYFSTWPLNVADYSSILSLPVF